MQIKLYSVIILLICMVLVFVSNGFTQQTLLDPSVRLIYFLPNDRPARPDRIEALRQLIKDAQEFYADEMERHGYGRKTFRVETDTNGEPIVHRIDGKLEEDYYYEGNSDFKIWEEIFEHLDDFHHVYFVAIDLSHEALNDGDSCGLAGVSFFPMGGHSQLFAGKIAFRHRDETQGEEALGGSAIIPASGDCFEDNRGFLHTLRATTHELAHAFGLDHDFSDPDSAVGGRGFRFSECDAEWLSVSRFFNNNPVSNNAPGDIQLISTPTYSPEGINIGFEVTDADGLHQAQLLVPEIYEGTSWGPYRLFGCKRLNGETSTIEFISEGLIVEPVDRITLQIIDVNGNITWATFLVDIASALPPPKFVSIPDTNLAKAVREALDLSPNARITDQKMWELIELHANQKQIKNLTGLEHATQLTYLFLYENQISNLDPLLALTHLKELGLDGNNIRDISRLAQMKQLQTLFIGGNPISDFTPIAKLNELKALALFANNIRDIALIANLQQLRWLYLSHNQIQDVRPLAQLTNLETLHLQNNSIHDISPFANLTKLTDLQLGDNQISDVSPLTGLVNLEALSLIGNPIKNRRPLLAMLRRNPEIKIYLKEGGDPLPVSLSHFRAELAEAGVIIKWITESELDNAGFNILRSETKDGEFKIVNSQLIQGAGTTSERQTYTWKDTTAKPNVVYYYQIEDISHAGNRKQLATVRMRGYVSAAGKLTTKWGDLKLQE